MRYGIDQASFCVVEILRVSRLDYYVVHSQHLKEASHCCMHLLVMLPVVGTHV